MIGYTLTRCLIDCDKIETIPVVRKHNRSFFKNTIVSEISYDFLDNLISSKKPQYIINCIGLTKHIESKDHRLFFYPNILIPHFLKILSNKYKFSLIHISSDCVFNGQKGLYNDKDFSNAVDYYGISKSISENDLKDSAMILRTSTVGHEYDTYYGLLEWFLKQSSSIKGYDKAFFNGVTTITLAKIINKIILSNNFFETGIFNIGGQKISKYKFLLMIKKIYMKNIDIIPCNSLIIDRTLVQSKKISDIWNHETWEQQIKTMKDDFEKKFYQ